MENRKYSDYYNQLEDIVKERYCDKLDLIGAGVTVAGEDELWFHTSCLRISTIPKGNWYCPDCRKRKKVVVK